jgi:hypothetical protein
MCKIPTFRLFGTVFALFLLTVQTPLFALADDAANPDKKISKTTVQQQEPVKKPRPLYTTLDGVAQFYKSTTTQVRGWFTHGHVTSDVAPGQETTKPRLLRDVDNAHERPPVVQTFFSVSPHADPNIKSPILMPQTNYSPVDFENCQGSKIADGSLSDSTAGLKGLHLPSGVSLGMCLKF